ncbi:MAG TPA: aldehyde dehydrogenase family protein [Nocardioides sp.]|jgi:acyl-CoA reductase-like NAD-dependent aldehyde dehydrogenase|uniref:aldehyde dehydrogenase family protein n=1 Tax=Nocardioides sp. TaxID=35761 RepID=UPI002E3258EF|nr:aldehyde dehydrogenase family protein [Nocardioides sp.]HEX3931317.1 aldehyde dehydrogenase family protein [Nocardioides sp.]
MSETTALGAPGPTWAELEPEPTDVPQARAMLERAEWASRAFRTLDKAAVDRILEAVAVAAVQHAQEYAERAVAETGFGVVEHKRLKNEACSRGVLDHYAGSDFVTPRVDPDAKIVEVPRPAGVVLALTPSTNPVATVYFKVLLSLMTRNAVVVSPHPMAKRVCADAARTLAAAAEAAGAPAGVVQVVTEPTIPLIDALMTDERTSVIVATGGNAVVRAAYRSGNPALGVGPGNVPAFVDATADLRAAAQRIVDSKSFDNSCLCTNESVVIVEESVADAFGRALRSAGAYLLDADQAQRLRELVFPHDRFTPAVVGRPATWLAEQAGIQVPHSTKVLVGEFDQVVPEEVLAREKLTPLLGLVRVPSVAAGIKAARAVLRISGAGHSAAVHSTDPGTVLAFGAACNVLRVSVNVGNSLGGSGISTNLAPTMTIGTGYAGGSSVGENLRPDHLLNWVRLAYNADPQVAMGDFAELTPWRVSPGLVPPYPVASNARAETGRRHEPGAVVSTSSTDEAPCSTDADGDLREELRRIIVEELHDLIGGDRRG